MEFVRGINFAPFSLRGTLADPSVGMELWRMQELAGADTVIFCPSGV